MAILQSLTLGNHVLISNWGGHSDYKKYFINRVFLMPVELSQQGPVLKAKKIAYFLDKTLKSISFSSENFNFTKYYSLERQVKRIHSVLSANYVEKPLEFTDLANAIFEQKNILFEKHPTQIFTDYSDPLFLNISQFYIGN
jgi:hypothetical protein